MSVTDCELSNVCPICIETIIERDICRLPGCGHTYHCICLINCMQYDIRCAICRNKPMGLIVREDNNTIVGLDEQAIGHFYCRWRQYTRRRLSFLKRNPILFRSYSLLRILKKDINKEVQMIQHLYTAKCREIWLRDEHIIIHKKNVCRMRRRELRHEQIVRQGVEDAIGPLPVFI
jgi:hypothetical protein